jgi:hypothetical protein
MRSTKIASYRRPPMMRRIETKMLMNEMYSMIDPHNRQPRRHVGVVAVFHRQRAESLGLVRRQADEDRQHGVGDEPRQRVVREKHVHDRRQEQADHAHDQVRADRRQIALREVAVQAHRPERAGRQHERRQQRRRG